MNHLSESELPDRVFASLPADDPRFTGLRAELAALVGRGRGSPIPRMLGEYALLGYLLVHGRIPLAGSGPAVTASDGEGEIDAAALAHVTAALGEMDFC